MTRELGGENLVRICSLKKLAAGTTSTTVCRGLLLRVTLDAMISTSALAVRHAIVGETIAMIVSTKRVSTNNIDRICGASQVHSSCPPQGGGGRKIV